MRHTRSWLKSSNSTNGGGVVICLCSTSLYLHIETSESHQTLYLIILYNCPYALCRLVLEPLGTCIHEAAIAVGAKRESG